MGSSQKIFSGVVWTTALNVVNAVYGFISVPILLSYFGKSQYGLIGLATSINAYMQLMDMGLGTTSLRFFSVSLAKKEFDITKKTFQTSLSFYTFVGILNALILFVISIFSSEIFNVTESQDLILKDLFYILIFSAILGWFSSSFDQLIRSTENVAWIQERTLFAKFCQILILAATVLFKLDIVTYFALTSLAVVSIILPLSIKKIRSILPFISFRPKLYKNIFMSILPYSLNLFSFSIFQFSFYNLRSVFIGMQGNVGSIVDFNIMGGIASAVNMFSGAFLGSLLPSTSKAMALNNKGAFYRVAYDGTKYISIILCFCSFGCLAVCKDLLSLYVGEKYLYLIPWLCLWLLTALGNHNQAISSLILSSDDVRPISYSSVAASVIGLLASWFLIPYFQAGGAVIGYCLYMMVQLTFYYLYYWPKRMNISSKKILSYSFGPYVLIGLISSLLCIYLPIHLGHFLRLLILGILFSAVYILVSYITLTDKDKSFIRSLINLKL